MKYFHHVALFFHTALLTYNKAEGTLEKNYEPRRNFWSKPVRRPQNKGNNAAEYNSPNHGRTVDDASGFDVLNNIKNELTSSSDNHDLEKQMELHYHRSDTPSPITSIASAILMIIQDTFTVDRCRLVVCWFGAYWLFKKFFEQVGTLLEEMQDEMLKEDHDNLLFTAETVSQVSTSITQTSAIDQETNTVSSKTVNSQRKSQQHLTNNGNGKDSNSQALRKKASRSRNRITPKYQYAKDLIVKLHAAGLPLESQSNVENHTPSTLAKKTAESVLRSLTKTEGSLLANCLLLPKGALANESTADQMDPIVEWENIGGLADIKESLMDLISPLTASLESPKTNSYGDLLSHPSGILLYGPPGCGKTLLAKALAFTAGARFLCVKHSDIQRKYYGETNLRVRALFSLARKIQPCIIFVDEVDGIFRERYSGGSGGEEHDTSRELKTEFMQLWDGISSVKSDKIFVMGATNRPFDVDTAFLRRMPRAYFVGLPDLPGRISVLRCMLNDVPLSPDFDIEMIAGQTQGYSPSDLKELLRVAALAPLREARAKSIGQNPSNFCSRSMSSFLQSPVSPLRALKTADVLKARRIVSATQYSATYRSAMADYISRSQGSLASPIADFKREDSDTGEEDMSDVLSDDENMSSFDDE